MLWPGLDTAVLKYCGMDQVRGVQCDDRYSTIQNKKLFYKVLKEQLYDCIYVKTPFHLEQRH